MTYIICYSFFGDNMKIFKNINFLIIIVFIMVLLLSLFYLKNDVMISESTSISFIDDSDIIGNINIESINLNAKLLQGLDNTFYFSHDYLRANNESGEIFLDYQGDLLNDNNPIIYSNIDNIRNINDVNINDKIKINYLNNLICYEIIDGKKNNNLNIKIVDKTKKINLYAKKAKC